MKSTAVWREDTETGIYVSLATDLEVDVAIIGGGITGITAGLLLARAGKNVALLEAGRVSGGTTGYSTGNLYSPVNEMLHTLQSKYSREKATGVAGSRSAAIGQIEGLIRDFGIDCSFEKASWYLIADSRENSESIDKEYKACVDAGLHAYLEQFVPIQIPVYSAVRVDNQAQINPLKYVKSLAVHAQKAGCQIYEDTRVTEIKNGEVHTLVTARGSVRARHIIHATHVPKGFMTVQTLLGPYREYALAVRLESGEYPKGIFWVRQGESHYSLRSYQSPDGDKFLLVLGEPHKVGQKDNNTECFHTLESYVRRHFNVKSVEYRWGAQHYRSADLLPYIGAVDKKETIHIATGYSTDGLVYGTLAAMILSGNICGSAGPWSELYDPGRHNPLKSAGNFIKENLNVAMQYLKDLPGHAGTDELSGIARGEGSTIMLDGHKCAAYRDDAGKVHVVSAVCPHMGCIVHWNRAEKSWDCPCHGSRFNAYGCFIEGPAFTDLAKVEVK